MSKSLKTLQTISKIGKIISDIIFVCSIIGAVAVHPKPMAVNIGKHILPKQSILALAATQKGHAVTVIQTNDQSHLKPLFSRSSSR